MQSKILLKWSALVIGIVAISFFIINIFPTPRLPIQDSFVKPVLLPTSQSIQDLIDGKLIESTQGAVSINKPTLGLPIRLTIPKINVDAPVIYVGITSDGAMDVPKNPNDVAWFNLGVRPGEVGSAVISGHYGWKNSIPAVFDNLNKLQKGDKLYVKDENGVINTFIVRESKNYGENQDATSVFDSSDGKAHLNLITCTGIWNKANKSYSNRLIVFTDKE